jgi:hypothetical protein
MKTVNLKAKRRRHRMAALRRAARGADVLDALEGNALPPWVRVRMPNGVAHLGRRRWARQDYNTLCGKLAVDGEVIPDEWAASNCGECFKAAAPRMAREMGESMRRSVDDLLEQIVRDSGGDSWLSTAPSVPASSATAAS